MSLPIHRVFTCMSCVPGTAWPATMMGVKHKEWLCRSCGAEGSLVEDIMDSLGALIDGLEGHDENPSGQSSVNGACDGDACRDDRLLDPMRAVPELN